MAVGAKTLDIASPVGVGTPMREHSFWVPPRQCCCECNMSQRMGASAVVGPWRRKMVVIATEPSRQGRGRNALMIGQTHTS